MATITYILGAAAILVAVGWLIGREIARSSVSPAIPQIVVLQNSLHPLLRDALERLGTPPHTLQFSEVPSAPGACSVFVAEGDLIKCRPVRLSVKSYALQNSSISDFGAERAWERSARLIQLHGDSKFGLPDRLLGKGFERTYDIAWRRLSTGLSSDLPVAYRNLRLSLADWPADRDAERASALANMAFICANLEEPEVTRLARRLEGHDAAREALRLQYDVEEYVGTTGLRALIQSLQQEIAGGARPSGATLQWTSQTSRFPQAI